MMSLLLLVILLYADDTLLYTSGPSLDTVLTTLQASFKWAGGTVKIAECEFQMTEI
jgi:hypothetical protein